MKLNQDQLVEGPFGSNACYEQTFNQDGKEIKTWLCFGSGFTTSTLMTEGSKAVNDLLETSPELYKDLLHTDKEKKVSLEYPSILHVKHFRQKWFFWQSVPLVNL